MGGLLSLLDGNAVDKEKAVCYNEKNALRERRRPMLLRLIRRLIGGLSLMLCACPSPAPSASEAEQASSHPRLPAPAVVQTRYPTADVVVADFRAVAMGYAVDPSGRADSTEGIRQVLNDCAAAGGGTVFLEAGDYLVTSLISIPPFVTLRGDWRDPDAEGEDYGTVIHVRTPPADRAEAGLFLLGGSAGVNGLTVYYPEQSLEHPVPYPFAFYTKGQGNDYMLSTVKNVTVINGYRGIGACVAENNGHEQLTVDNFKGCFLHTAAQVYDQADVGTWKRVTVSPRYWEQAKGRGILAAKTGAAAAYMRAHSVGLMLGDLEWTEFLTLTVEHCRVGIRIIRGKRIQFAGSLYDVRITDCEEGVVVEDLDSRWGMLIAKSYIEGGIRNETQGMVKLCDAYVMGECVGTVVPSGEEISLPSFDSAAVPARPAPRLFLLQRQGEEEIGLALQALLDRAGETGGGVVYLPSGVYRLEKPIRVPSGVELRGSASLPTRDAGGLCGGTAIVTSYGMEEEIDPLRAEALITLDGKGAGLRGIRILYPENGPRSGGKRTAFAVRGRAEEVYFVDGALVAAGYGVDFRGCDRHYIEKITSCCYHNTFLLGGKGGMLMGCLQNGTAISRCVVPGRKGWITEQELFTVLFDPILRQTAQYIVLDGAIGQVIANTFSYGCHDLIVQKRGEGTLAVNVGSDNIGGAQTILRGGSLCVVNAMRYNGVSYRHEGGELSLYNRLTILDKSEESYRRAL